VVWFELNSIEKIKRKAIENSKENRKTAFSPVGPVQPG
jgi:hypothetical protein